ncbi:MAG: hypothetical protein K8I27_09880 [Planctomycetes bacterium]|nr:hypothetical protein [Planctomycetota bacterium]
MARRKTRKVAKPRKGTRVRSGGLRVVKAGLAAIMVGTIRMMRAVLPSGDTVNAWAAGAWHSRGVRRCAGVAGGIVVLGLLSWVMLHNLRQNDRYRLDPGRIELSAEPSWATGSLAKQLKNDIEEDLRADLADLGETSAFDDDVMDAITSRVETNPWVRRVVRIERRFPGDPEGFSSLLPVLEIRRPAVAIETAEHYVLVDGDAIVLPLKLPRDNDAWAHFEASLSERLRIVRGVEGDVPAAGAHWGNEQVSAALSMERVIRRAKLDRALPIHAIELVGIPQAPDARGRVHYQMNGGVVLIPDQTRMPGTTLLWGRPPVHASTLEASPNDKLERLKSRLRELDSVGDVHIDLRHRG